MNLQRTFKARGGIGGVMGPWLADETLVCRWDLPWPWLWYGDGSCQTGIYA